MGCWSTTYAPPYKGDARVHETCHIVPRNHMVLTRCPPHPPYLQKCLTSRSLTSVPSTLNQNRISTSQQRGITRTYSSSKCRFGQSLSLEDPHPHGELLEADSMYIQNGYPQQIRGRAQHTAYAAGAVNQTPAGLLGSHPFTALSTCAAIHCVRCFIQLVMATAGTTARLNRTSLNAATATS